MYGACQYTVQYCGCVRELPDEKRTILINFELLGQILIELDKFQIRLFMQQRRKIVTTVTTEHKVGVVTRTAPVPIRYNNKREMQ